MPAIASKTDRRTSKPPWAARLLTLPSREAKGARMRRRCAEGIEHAVDRAGATRLSFSAAVPVSPEADGDARGALLDLAERLRRPGPVNPGGLVLVRRLLCDGAGPLYYGEPGELRRAATIALEALDAHAISS